MNKEMKTKLEKINQEYLLGRGVFKYGLSERTRIISESNNDISIHRGVYLVANLLTDSGEQEFVFDEYMSNREIKSEIETISSTVREVRESELPENERISFLKDINQVIFNGRGRWKKEYGVFSDKNDLSDCPTEQFALIGKIRSKNYPDHVEELILREYEDDEELKRLINRAKCIQGL